MDDRDPYRFAEEIGKARKRLPDAGSSPDDGMINSPVALERARILGSPYGLMPESPEPRWKRIW